MARRCEVHVHLLPTLIPDGQLSGGIAVVIDVLRATTTIVHALTAGCTAVLPCLEIEEARGLADTMRAGKVLLAGERGGQPLPGFDLGNSPGDFTPQACRDRTVVLTTTNGTKALLRAETAQRTMAAAFVNFSAVCEQLRQAVSPTHIVCSGTDGEVSLEDTLLAGALVDFLAQHGDAQLNDSARLSWDCYEHHGGVLQGAVELGRGGAKLKSLGYHDDIAAACQVDRFHVVPELRRDPLRLEIGAVGIVKSHWRR